MFNLFLLIIDFITSMKAIPIRKINLSSCPMCWMAFRVKNVLLRNGHVVRFQSNCFLFSSRPFYSASCSNFKTCGAFMMSVMMELDQWKREAPKETGFNVDHKNSTHTNPRTHTHTQNFSLEDG
jgi:hypothetical protein